MTAIIKNERCENGAIVIPESANNSTTEEEEDICELEHLRKLFIGGLASQTTEESLKAFYGKWGTVVDAVVMRDPTTKRSRGFGFITYTKAASVDEAQKNRPHVIDNKAVDPKRALPRPERETRETNISVKKLFVGGLKDNHDEKCLEEYFSKFGNVVSVKILTDKTTGKRRGFAFIEYDDYDSVDKAILQKAHTIKYVVVDVKKSVYKQENKVNEGGNSDPNNAINSSKQTPVGPKPTNARPPVPQQPMPPYQQGPQPAPYQQGAPYNYWGPPQQPPPPQYNPYPQPPTNGWNTPYGWNGWNAGPPPPQQAPPANWYGNQWPQNTGPAPVPQPPVGPTPNGNWNAPPVNGPPHQPGPPANFGSGYQQNYGGGPSKNNPPNTNRMHPYAPPQQNGNYANTNQQAPPQAYNGYGPNKQPPAPIPPSKNGAPPPNTAAQMANKFRR